MNKSILGGVALAVLAATITFTTPNFAAPGRGFAQGQAGAGHRMGGAAQMAKLAAYLNLSDTQKAEIKPILQNANQQAKAVRQNASLTPDAKKTQLKAIRQGAMKQIRALLTPAQLAKLKALRQRGGKG